MILQVEEVRARRAKLLCQKFKGERQNLLDRIKSNTLLGYCRMTCWNKDFALRHIKNLQRRGFTVFICNEYNDTIQVEW